MKIPLLIVALGTLLSSCENRDIAPDALIQRSSSARVSSEDARKTASTLMDADVASAQTSYSRADVQTQESKVQADAIALGQASR